MKAGWEIKRIGDICAIKPPKKEARTKIKQDDFVSFLPMEDLSSDKMIVSPVRERKFSDVVGSYTYFSENDILLAKITPCFENGKLGIARLLLNETGFGSSEYIVLRAGKSIIPEFLYYFLSQDTFRKEGAERMAGAVGHKRLPVEFVNEYSIPLPSLPEQRRIVAILDEAFADIAAAKEKAEQNLKNAKEVFESYLKQIFNINKNGWIKNNIGEICLLKSGTTMPIDLEKETGDIPYLKVADMNFEENNGYITMSSRFLDKKDIKDSMIIPKGAVIFPKRGGAILTNKKRMTSIPICADLNIMAVIPTGKIEAKLLYYYFLDVDMKKIGTGSSIPQINNYDISPLSIAYPRDLSKQKEIVSFLDEISEETGTLESIYQQKLSNLEELKKSLLQQAFSGAL